MKFIELLEVLTSRKVKLYTNCIMDDENLIYQGNTGKLIHFEHLHNMNVFQIIAPDCGGCVSIALEGSQIEQVKKLYEAKHL